MVEQDAGGGNTTAVLMAFAAKLEAAIDTGAYASQKASWVQCSNVATAVCFGSFLFLGITLLTSRSSQLVHSNGHRMRMLIIANMSSKQTRQDRNSAEVITPGRSRSLKSRLPRLGIGSLLGSMHWLLPLRKAAEEAKNGIHEHVRFRILE